MIGREPVLLSEGLPAHLRAKHCVAVPVAYQDRLLGVLAVFDKESRGGVETFTEDDPVAFRTILFRIAVLEVSGREARPGGEGG